MPIKTAAALPVAIALAVASLVLSAGGQTPPPGSAARVPQIPQEVRDRLARHGRVRVIVELTRTGAARLLARLAPRDHRVTRRFRTGPYVALEVTAAGLTALQNSPLDVVRILSDPIVRPTLDTSVPLIQGDQVWEQGIDGSGTVIAVLDTGVDSAHPFLAGKVVEEACYSSQSAGESESFCPHGLNEEIGPGSAAPCPLDDCLHGTHVAGIAAGDGAPAAQPFSGVARGARLMAVQVFSNITDPVSCGGAAPCLGAFTSDIIAALERVHAVAPQYNIAAVNMSLGGGSFSEPCDNEPYKPIIDTLRSAGIATVVASGNNGWTSSMAAPGCISSVVSVGSTDKQDSVSWFSNATPFLQLLAPGESILSSVPGGDYMELQGTSMATPHVAGSWALLKQAAPTASVDTVLNALRQTGLPIADTRPGGSVTVPRVRVFQALATLAPISNPLPVADALLPPRIAAGVAFTLTVSGSGFNAFSIVRWNGAARPSTATSTHTLEASIPASDVATIGQADVSVFNPAPGGGTSSSRTFTIDPPPTLTVSATTTAPGDLETVTLANGFGGSEDRLALAAVGAADDSSLQWTYVGEGVTDRTWTVTMPASAGAYEFRLFAVENSRVATSAPVTVDPSLNPRPVASSLFPTHAPVGGAALTLTVNGSGFMASSIVQWNGAPRPTTFVSATQMRISVDTSDLASSGTAQVTVQSPTPGGGTSSALTFTIDPPPALTVSATTVDAGSSMTVTLAGSSGAAGDWLALAASGAPDTSYLNSTYVGTGVTTRTWTVTMPGTAGTYEFRLFLASTYNRGATSAPITVTESFNPAPAASSLFPSHASAGSAAFTLTVNGSNFVASSVVQWNGTPRSTTFVSDTQVRASIAASDLASSGTAQVTVQTPAPGGGTSSVVSFAIDPPPRLTVSATSADVGSSVTVTLTGSSGGDGDWLALALTTAPDTSYLQSTYVGSGVTTRTWAVTMPLTAGAYQFRLFLASTYNRAATSPTVTVTGSANPVPVASSLFPTHASASSAALTLTVNGSGFIASSVVQWNGAARSTTYVSATQLRASIAAGDLASSGTAQVTV
jgi:subtilisin family serine protease